MSDHFFSIPLDRPRRLYFYHVTGSAAFPFDLLRLDRAWPASSDDSNLLTASGNRTIRLTSFYEPTVERWSNLSWTIGRSKF